MRWLITFVALLVSGVFALYQGRAAAESPVDAPPVLSFSGYEWTVKTSRGSVGPGPNVFGADTAWVDKEGHLHLTIVRKEGRWVCAEIVSKRNFAFGEYEFFAETLAVDQNAVFGMFVWDLTAR